MDAHGFCGFCGAEFAVEQVWPRMCAACGNITYHNPLPVAVVIAPVDLGGRVGVLAVRRAIAPRAGWLALPGGFIEVGESWQEAAARELREETGVVVHPTAVRVFDVCSAPDVLIVFGQVDPLPHAALPPLLPTAEASAIVILTEPVDLAFPLHTAALRKYLA
jgi:8-oxo-dGTP pyrophosphatase MutT (NUDIX family)